MGWLGKILGGAAGFALGGPMGAGLGASLGSSIDSQASADKLNKQAQGYAQQRYAAGAPFRSKLAEVALNLPSERPDLSGIFADPGNPYARPVSRLTAASFRPPQQSDAAPTGGLNGPRPDPGMERMMASMPPRMRSAFASRAFGLK